MQEAKKLMSKKQKTTTPVDVGILSAVERGGTLSDMVYERLRRGLMEGIWEPGQKLTARKLCQEFEVSLTPVREAMMRMGNEGGLDVTPARTFYVPRLNRHQYEEIVNLRLAIEPLAAKEATAKITEADIARLETFNENLRLHIQKEEFPAALQQDAQFHLGLYAYADRPVMYNIINTLWLRAGPTRNMLSRQYRRSLAGYENHCQIIEALRAGRAKDVRKHLARDLKNGSVMVLAALENNNET
jgi:DNA-binding GntR family transcriptional regulator